MREQKLELLKHSLLLMFTGLLLVVSIQLSLGEVGLQILGVQPISKKIEKEDRSDFTTVVAIQINQTK